MADPLRGPSAGRRAVLLRCRPTKVGGYPGPLIVHSTSAELPREILITIDSELLPPLDPITLATVRKDASETWSQYAPPPVKLPTPAPPPMRCEPRRRFVRGQDPVTKFVAWVEAGIRWVDVPV